MIIIKDPSVMELFFGMQGSIVPEILPQILFAAMTGLLAALVHDEKVTGSSDAWITFDFSPFTALGVAISLFLGFRNNACYDRWWEARKLLGTQLPHIRNLSRILLVVDRESAYRRHIVKLCVAHLHALHAQLRKEEAAILECHKYLNQEEISHVETLTNKAEGLLTMAGQVRTLH